MNTTTQKRTMTQSHTPTPYRIITYSSRSHMNQRGEYLTIKQATVAAENFVFVGGWNKAIIHQGWEPIKVVTL